MVQLAQQASVHDVWTKSYDARELQSVGTQVEYELTFSLERFRYRHLYEAELRRSFGTPNIAALMLLPLGTSGEQEAEDIAARAREAADLRLNRRAKISASAKARTWRDRIRLRRR